MIDIQISEKKINFNLTFTFGEISLRKYKFQHPPIRYRRQREPPLLVSSVLPLRQTLSRDLMHLLMVLSVQILQQTDETDHDRRSPSPEASSSTPA
jgi:hypothetical protein